MRSFVDEDSFFPFLFSYLFTSLEVVKDKHSGTVVVDIISNQLNVFFGPGLVELPFFLVVDPVTLVYLSLCLVLVSSLAVLLVVLPLSLEDVSVPIGHLSMAFHLVINEFSFVGIVKSGNFYASTTFSSVLDKVALVDVSVSVVDDSVAVEMTILELPFISFIFQSIGSLSIFLIVLEFSVIDSPTGFDQHSFTMLLPHDELTRILSVFAKVSKFSMSMEFIVQKLSFVFYLSLQLIDSAALFLAFVELARVSSTVSFFQRPVMQLVVFKSTLKLLPVRIDKLAVISVFEVVSHSTDVFRSIRVGDGSVDEISSLELSIEGAVSFLPYTLSVRPGFFEISLVSISIGILKFAKGGVSFIKFSFELGSVFIEHGAFAVGSAELVDLAGVGSSIARLCLVGFRLIATAQ